MNATSMPQSFGPVFAYFEQDQPVHYADATSARSPQLPDGTPVDMLLAALAFCMVKSVEWAATDHKAALRPFAVKVIGTKAPDLPGRIEVMDIALIGDLVDDPATARQIMKTAKAICTVSNTLNCTINVTLEPPHA